ncbi:hypothetical protein [Lewinella sp. IMCC34191]|uniref:hypothetical protein n=1 Tax=Lewinella sp. IMCC34191 TaxID=2259172 RepID=UPI000E278C18|nr:hypothetical protein [Lewinella sp. IMCC34191]
MKNLSTFYFLRAGLMLATVCGPLLLTAQYRGGSGDGSAAYVYSSSIAPLDFLDVSAASEGDRVRLIWRTTNEVGTHYFDVQRSSDGQTFTKIGQLPAAGTSAGGIELTYKFMDETPPHGKSYYRLLSTDFDGSSRFSPVVSVIHAGSAGTLEMYPNPNAGDRISFRLPSFVAGERLEVDIFDASRRQLLAHELVYPDAGSAHLTVERPLKPGSYLVKLRAANRALPAQLLIVTE